MSQNNYIKINELCTKLSGDQIKLKVLLIESKILTKKDSSQFMSLKIQDESGNMEFPVWDYGTQKLITDLSLVGKVLGVSGFLSLYEGKYQIVSPKLQMIEGASPKECLPRYTIPSELISYFFETIEGLSIKYKTFLKIAFKFPEPEAYKDEDSIGSFLNIFFEAPAAQSHHHAKIGGLFIHTAGVMKNIEGMINNYVTNPFLVDASSKIDRDRLIFKAILHDLGKVWEYEWETGIKRKDLRVGHIIKICSYIEEINNSTGIFSTEEIDDICSSILCHHGSFEKYGKIEIKTIEDQLLHLSDMIDSQIVGSIEKG